MVVPDGSLQVEGTHGFLQFRQRILRRSVPVKNPDYNSCIFGMNLYSTVCTIVVVAKRNTADLPPIFGPGITRLSPDFDRSLFPVTLSR